MSFEIFRTTITRLINERTKTAHFFISALLAPFGFMFPGPVLTTAAAFILGAAIEEYWDHRRQKPGETFVEFWAGEGLFDSLWWAAGAAWMGVWMWLAQTHGRLWS